MMQERRVAFQDDRDVVEIPGRNDYTTDEISFMYFSSWELEIIRLREKRWALELSVYGGISSKHDDDDDSTGLESVETKSMRTQHIEIGIQTVLTEQELELIEGGYREDEYIAKIYRNATRQNQVLARHRGFDNAIQVKAGNFAERILSPSSRSTTITDCNPRKRDLDICRVGNPIESPPETARLSVRLSRMIVVPIDCE
ncbi:unnamed protein product [Cylindrotheca closterium]|uniref:Uncharacterized protein n=1 Tax=Cylindrotheca closterium TaxID=2856 RepID=A0AAD2CK44_9STRA|nr:unnamed protein product [Cylindrotheca closterium]